jgi:outer membrane protein W
LASGQGVSDTQVGFEAVGGAGCDVYFGPLLVGLEVKYIWLEPQFNFTGVSGVASLTQKLNMSGITLEAYIGYRF